jgi:hypothetical protein
MRRVQLDFVRRAGHPVLGAAVLVLGLSSTLGACYVFSVLDGQRGQLEGQLWRSRAPAAPSVKGEAEALAAADRLSVQFRRPWEQLLLGLEGIDVPGLRLNQILPQTGPNSRIQLSGDADQSEALYQYMRQLSALHDLRDVYLVQQRWDEQGRVLQFQIVASWDQPLPMQDGR